MAQENKSQSNRLELLAETANHCPDLLIRLEPYNLLPIVGLGEYWDRLNYSISQFSISPKISLKTKLTFGGLFLYNAAVFGAALYGICKLVE